MIPNDPYMLLSWLNMKLRDEYDSFGELCRSESLEAAEITRLMAYAGYVYDAERNRFRC